MRAEYPGLLARSPGELVPADAVREAGIVPDHRAAARLAAGDGLLEHDRLQALGGGVDGGGQARRSRPDDDDVAFVYVVVGAAADGLDDLRGRRLDHRVVVVPDHDREVS